jgi:hypothetical protein
LLTKETSNASIGKCFLGDKKKRFITLLPYHLYRNALWSGGDETVKASFDLKDLLRIPIGLRPCGFFL